MSWLRQLKDDVTQVFAEKEDVIWMLNFNKESILRLLEHLVQVKCVRKWGIIGLDVC